MLRPTCPRCRLGGVAGVAGAAGAAGASASPTQPDPTARGDPASHLPARAQPGPDATRRTDALAAPSHWPYGAARRRTARRIPSNSSSCVALNLAAVAGATWPLRLPERRRKLGRGRSGVLSGCVSERKPRAWRGYARGMRRGWSLWSLLVPVPCVLLSPSPYHDRCDGSIVYDGYRVKHGKRVSFEPLFIIF